jgi:hypothetical protein
MVDQTAGILTSLNTGSLNGGAGERVLIDYKDAILDYKVYRPSSNVFLCRRNELQKQAVILILLSQNLPWLWNKSKKEQLLIYQHTKLRSERVAVKEWGLAVGVTRRMIEDSRFNEVEMALNEARRAVDRHLTQHVTNVIFGVG